MVDKARRTYRSGYRRILRDLHGVECLDPITLNDYRVSMKLGTRNVFNVTWKHLRELEATNGVTLAEPPAMPRVRFAHPLMPDVLTLTGYLNFDQMTTLTWGAVPAPAQRVELERALERIFEFQTGRSALEATADTPLIPTRHGLPMREWQVRFIANSVHHESDHVVDRSAKDLAELLVFAGVNGVFLRNTLTALWRARPSLARLEHADGDVAELLRFAREKQFPLLSQALARRATDKAGAPGW
jgi:hypothetical protein